MPSLRRLTSIAVAAALAAAALPASAASAATAAPDAAAASVAAPTFTIPGADRVGPTSWRAPVDASLTLAATGLVDAAGSVANGPGLLVEERPLDRGAFTGHLLRAAFTAGSLTPGDAPDAARTASILDGLEDVGPGHPHAADIAFAIDQSLLSVRSGGSFEPDVHVTRATAAMLLLRAIHAAQPALPSGDEVAGPYFGDVTSGLVGQFHIDTLAAAGILPPAANFEPSRTLARSHFHGWLQRLTAYLDAPVDPGPAGVGVWAGEVTGGAVSVAFDHRDAGGAPRGTGPHTYVPVVDGAGQGTVTVTWTADGGASVSFTTTPRVRTTSPYAELAFASSPTASRFTCDLNGRGWSGCVSPTRFGGLPVRDHRYTVRAHDASGAVIATAVHEWTVLPPFSGGGDGTRFSDVGGVHADAIALVAGAEIALGYDDGTYRPNATVTRAQMASFLDRALDLPPGTGRFSDVGGPHAASIAAVARAGITEGYEDGSFRPNATVTRQQMASFVTRAFQLERTTAHGFTDVAGPHADAVGAVARARIASGYDDGTFRPTRPVTRAQMATFLRNALQR